MLDLQAYEIDRKKRIELNNNIKSISMALRCAFLLPETKEALEITIEELMKKLGELDIRN